jgi:hypothetical protein
VTGDNLRAQISSRRQFGELAGAADCFSNLLESMVLEGGLQLADNWTFQPSMNLAPVIGCVSVAQPLVRKADPSGKANTAIDHQDTAVRASIYMINPPGGDRMVISESTTGFFESLDVCVIQFQARPIPSSKTRTRTPARERSASASQNSVATWQEWKRNASKLTLSRAPLMASSIPRKIIFPLCRSSILFPGIGSGSAKAWAEGKNSESSTVNLWSR